MDNVVCEWVSFLDYFSGIEKKSAPHYKPRFGLRLEIKSEIPHVCVLFEYRFGENRESVWILVTSLLAFFFLILFFMFV